MNISTQNIVPDQDVFAAMRPPTLAQILLYCEAELTGTALRDTRSAFHFLEQKVGIDLNAFRVSPQPIRDLFGTLSAASLGTSEKRVANIASGVRKSIEKFGPNRVWITREIELAPAWKLLLDRIPKSNQRWGLSKFAAYCTVKGIAPEEVSSKILIGFQAALEAESLSRDPVNIRKRAIASWNMCVKNVSGWPQTRLKSPYQQPAYMYPEEAFPMTTRAEIAAFETLMTNPNPLDPDAPIHSYRPDTLKSYRNTIRRLLSALVREKAIPIESITSLAVLFEGNNLRDALQVFVKPGRDAKQDYAYKMATQMRTIAKHFLKLPEEQLKMVDGIVSLLRNHLSQGMGQRNFERLDQFDEEAVVKRLLNLPNEQVIRALKLSNPVRRAKGVERALMLSICIFASLRAKNLRRLRLDRNLRRVGDQLFVELFKDETKNRAFLKLEMPEEVINLLDTFVEAYRPLLPGSDGPYLFPGQTGGPRSYSAVRDAVGVKVFKLAGIRISPHLYRHAISKIVFERHPELVLDLSRRHGHKKLNTTYQSYLGTEGPAVSRRINEVLKRIGSDESGKGRSTRGKRK